jgi:hypothetical protein
VQIHYPQGNPSLATVVNFTDARGARTSTLLGPAESVIVLGGHSSAGAIALRYMQLGLEHIAGGIDHLLFVLCLLWIAATPRRIFLTITGFTLAHSLTLLLATLNIVRAPIAAVEASIALSIVFMLTEIVKGPGRASLVWRYPIVVSGAFGLLHGFGFASALQDIGLPEGDLPLALLCFNLGVELGQLLFVAAFMLLGLLARALLTRVSQWVPWQARSRIGAIYSVGALAGYWLIDRSIPVIT